MTLRNRAALAVAGLSDALFNWADLYDADRPVSNLDLVVIGVVGRLDAFTDRLFRP